MGNAMNPQFTQDVSAHLRLFNVGGSNLIMKKYLFENASITIIVKAPNEFMAACYANQYMEKRYLTRFETSDAIELDNDMDFGVIAVKNDGSKLEMFNSENLFYV